MNTRQIITIAASLGLALAAQASFAAPTSHIVSEAQLDQIHAGASATEVSQTLGAPENVTSWMSGEQSMVYELSTPNSDHQVVYVDLGKDNKVTDVQVVTR